MFSDNKNFVCVISFIYLILGYSFQSQALTPEKYCASLATTSCEVLNANEFAVSAQTVLQLKYCRNQKFKSVSYQINSQTDNAGEYSIVMGVNFSLANACTKTTSGGLLLP